MTHLYESRKQPLISRRAFVTRMGRHFAAVLVLVGVSLVIGIVGYHWLAQFSWVDSFLNAAMLLGGMGPVGDIASVGGKVFAGIFSLYAGLVLIGASALLLTPILHRVIHRLHVDDSK
ncbi:MAG TPA: hypothetical protein VGM77_05075 [Gemmatimonadales bacterium]